MRHGAGAPELGADHPRVDGHGGHPRARRQAALQLLGEEDVGQFGLGVGAPRAVRPVLLQAGLGKVDAAEGEQVGLRREVDDARVAAGPACGEERAEEEVCEQEVAKVVYAHLLLEAVLRQLFGGQGHDTGVVHQDVQLPVLGLEIRSELLYACEGAEIQRKS